MKQYLEIKETLSSEEMERLPQLIRMEVKDEESAITKANELKDLITGEKKCFIHTHEHYADPSLNKPCVVTELKLEWNELEERS